MQHIYLVMDVMNRDELLSSIDNIKCGSDESDDNVDHNGDADIEILPLNSCFYLSKIKLYPLYIYGLYISFNTTIYQSSLKVYYTFVVEVMMLFVSMYVITVRSAFSSVASNTIINILGLNECLDLIISFSVVLLFNHKSFQLILSRKKSNYNESRDSSLVRIMKDDRNAKNENKHKNKQKTKKKNNNIRTASVDETFHLDPTDSNVNYQSDTISTVNTNKNLGDRSKAITTDGKQIIILQPSTNGSIFNFNQHSERERQQRKKNKKYYKMSWDELLYVNTITRYTLLSGMIMIVSVVSFTSLLILRILWTLGVKQYVTHAEMVCKHFFSFCLLLLVLF